MPDLALKSQMDEHNRMRLFLTSSLGTLLIGLNTSGRPSVTVCSSEHVRTFVLGAKEDDREGKGGREERNELKNERRKERSVPFGKRPQTNPSDEQNLRYGRTDGRTDADGRVAAEIGCGIGWRRRRRGREYLRMFHYVVTH